MWCPDVIGQDGWVWVKQRALKKKNSPHKVGENALTGEAVNTLLPVNKIVEKHGLKADGAQLGHDTVGDYCIDVVVRNPVTKEILSVEELNGHYEVNAPYERSQTTALPLTALLYDLGGINNPQARKAIKTAITVAMMRKDGASQEDCRAYYEANSVSWSESNKNGDNFLKMLRSVSVRMVKAAVKIFPRK